MRPAILKHSFLGNSLFFTHKKIFHINYLHAMIQRIQSVFLLLAALGFAGLFFLPFATSPQPDAVLFADLSYDLKDHIILLILTALGVLGSLSAIFLFRNRVTQLRLSYIAVIAAILLVVVGVLLFLNATKTSTITAQHIEDGAGLYLIPLIITLLIFAIRGINKDEKTVRSMDRLR